MRTYAIGIGIVLAAVIVGALPANATETMCGKFSLTGGSKTVELVDLGEPGTSVGDLRIAERQLLNGDKIVGALSGESVILRLGDNDDHALMGDWRIRINGDTLITAALYARDNATNEYTPSLDVVILGGTGGYRGAYGTLEITEGDRPSYNFDISCRE